MFHTLVESNAATRPRVGGSVVSTLAHGLLVSGLVLATAKGRVSGSLPPEPRATFIPVTTPHVAPATARAASPSSLHSAPAPQGATPLPIVIDIAVGVPAVDLSRALHGAEDFTRGLTIGRPDGIVGGSPVGADGTALLEHQVDKPVLLAPGMPAPAYPELLRSAGISGTVMVEFVVDTLGRVESGSPRILSTEHEQFAASVRAILPTYRFLAAEAGGHRVRQLVRLPFRFSLNP